MTEVIKIDINEKYILVIKTEEPLSLDLINEQIELLEEWMKSDRTFHIIAVSGGGIEIKLEKVD